MDIALPRHKTISGGRLALYSSSRSRIAELSSACMANSQSRSLVMTAVAILATPPSTLAFSYFSVNADYLGYGKRLTRTMKMLGYPRSRQTLGKWVGEIAPGERKRRGPNPRRDPAPIEKKVQAVAELEARTWPAAEITERHGVSRAAPYICN